MADALLRIKVITDATQAALGLDQASKKASGFRSAMAKAALPAAAVGAAVVAVGKKAIDAASDFEQAQGAIEAVFGSQARVVEKFASSAAKNMGLSSAAYMNYAALVGGALKNAGFSTEQAVGKSNQLMQRAADLAATYGGTTADAVDAVNAAISRSEFDPLEKFNVSLNMTAVNAELAARGQDKLTGAALQHAKAQIIMQEIYKKSADAAGQYAREQDSAAGSAQTASAQWTNAMAALGKGLLPAVVKITGLLQRMAQFTQKNATVTAVIIGVIGALAVAVLAANAAIKIYDATLIITEAIQKATWLSNPVFLVIAAIIALVAVVVILYKKWKPFRDLVNATWAAIKVGARAVGSFIKAVFKSALNVVGAYFRIYRTIVITVFNAIRTIVRTVGNFIVSVFRNVRGVVQSVFSAIRGIISSVAGHVRSAFGGAVSFVRGIFTSLRGTIRDLIGVISGAGATLAAPFKVMGGAVNGVIGVIKSLINWVSSLIRKIAGIHFPSVPKGLSGILGKLNPFSAMAGGGGGGASPGPTLRRSGTYYAPAPSGFSARAAGVGTTTGRGAGLQIHIYGALDPEAVARQIRHILADHDRRTGKAAAG